MLRESIVAQAWRGRSRIVRGSFGGEDTLLGGGAMEAGNVNDGDVWSLRQKVRDAVDDPGSLQPEGLAAEPKLTASLPISNITDTGHTTTVF